MLSLRRNKSQRGFSYLELLVALIVLMLLASAAIPLARWDQKRRYEERLKVSLMLMRNAIDEYKKYTDAGLILQEDVDPIKIPPFPNTLRQLGFRAPGEPESVEEATTPAA